MVAKDECRPLLFSPAPQFTGITSNGNNPVSPTKPADIDEYNHTLLGWPQTFSSNHFVHSSTTDFPSVSSFLNLCLNVCSDLALCISENVGAMSKMTQNTRRKKENFLARPGAISRNQRFKKISPGHNTSLITYSLNSTENPSSGRWEQSIKSPITYVKS